jgi:hypothetical protein
VTRRGDRAQAGLDAVRQYGNGGETCGLPKLVETRLEGANKVTEWPAVSGWRTDNGPPIRSSAIADSCCKRIRQLTHRVTTTFNGNAPVRIAIEGDEMCRARSRSTLRTCGVTRTKNPVKQWLVGSLAEVKPMLLKFIYRAQGRWGLKRFCRHATTPIPSERRDHPHGWGMTTIPARGANIPRRQHPCTPSGWRWRQRSGIR